MARPLLPHGRMEAMRSGRGIWCLAFVVGCGGTSATTDPGTRASDGGADASRATDAALRDVSAEAGTGRLVVTVLNATTYASPPFAGATVALDAPGGGRREQVTDAMGQATFSDVDWTLGPADLVVHAPGYVPSALVDVHASDTNRCYLYPSERPSTRLSGAVLHRAHPEDYVFVSASNALAGRYVPPGDDAYSLDLFDAAPITLLATEYAVVVTGRNATIAHRAFAAVDLPAATADVTADVDMSRTLPMLSAHGHINVPSGASSAIATRSRAYVTVSTREASGAFVLGAFRTVAYDDASRVFEYTADYVQLPGASRGTVTTTYSLMVGDENSQVTVAGYPTDGATIADLPASPAIVQPASDHAVHDPIVFSAPPSGGALAGIMIFSGGSLAYVVSAANARTTTLTPPRLPSTADESASFAGPLTLQPYLCVPAPTTFDCDHYSAGALAPIVR